MGYTHYYYVDHSKITDEKREKFSELLLKVIKKAEQRGIRMSYSFWENEILFNWSEHQPRNKWIANGEGLLKRPSEDVKLTKDNISKIVWEWFAWIEIDFPVVHSNSTWEVDASYETMVFERKGREFNFCKTNYNPYDCVVTASLLLFKEIIPAACTSINSDGEMKDWVLWYLLLKEATDIKAEQIHFTSP